MATRFWPRATPCAIAPLIFAFSLAASDLVLSDQGGLIPLQNVIVDDVSGHYHRQSCPLLEGLKSSTLPRSAAVGRGTTVCPVCLPDGARPIPKLRVSSKKFEPVFKAAKGLESIDTMIRDQGTTAKIVESATYEYLDLRESGLNSDEIQLANQLGTAFASYRKTLEVWDTSQLPTVRKMLLLSRAELQHASATYAAASRSVK